MTITDLKRVSEIENCVSFLGCVEQRTYKSLFSALYPTLAGKLCFVRCASLCES